MRKMAGNTHSITAQRMAVILLVSCCCVVLSPLSAMAQGSGTVPIVHIPAQTEHNEEGPRGLLLGAASGKRWIKDEKVHDALKSGKVYRFYSLSSYAQESAGGKPILGEASGAAWYIPFKKMKESKSALVGIAGAWNALPRPVKSESVTQPAYLKVVAEVLRENGLTTAKPHISKMVRVDLEGKGQPSVIIEASSPDLYREPFAETTLKSGGYCFIIVRTPVNGQVKTLVLKGDYSGNKHGSMGQNVVRLSHVLDLNGSGEMVILLDWSYYEGGGIEVHRIRNGKSQVVLSASDGA